MHKCSVCSYTTNKGFNLKRHIESVHLLAQDIVAENRCTDAENRCIYTENRCTDAENRCTFKCPSCYKVYSRYQRLLEHKSKCNFKSHPFECESCHNILSSYCTLARHRKTCSKKQEQEEVKQLKKENEELRLQLSQTQTQNTTVANSSITSGQNTFVGDHNTANIININGLGKEDIGYLTDNPRFKSFMTKCINNQLDGVMEYLENKHFNPKHPENHNLKKLTKKDSFMECYDGEKWRTRYCDDIMHDVFHNMYKAFADFVETATQDGKLKKVWLDNFMSTVGTPLDWDVNCDNYEFNDRMTDEQKTHLKERVFALAIEYIYKQSKQKAKPVLAPG